jgi:ribulose-phosphate 3-epimerase
MEIGASVITFDPINLLNDIDIFESLRAINYYHIDVMDGSFVPRFGLYPEIVQRMSEITATPVDVHMMVDDVEFCVEQYGHIPNVKTISFHYFKNEGRLLKICDKIRKYGINPILVIDLSTNILDVLELIDQHEISGLMFMGIHPGVIDQVHRPETVIKKLEKLKQQKISFPEDFILQIDGAFNFQTAERLKNSGINSFVSGTSTLLHGVKNDAKFADRKKAIFDNYNKLSKILGLQNN